MASPSVEVLIDNRELDDFTDAMAKQVPYAVAVALTHTAAQARDKVREDLPRHFTLRREFTKNSIQFRRADKRDWPDCKATVGSIAPYMEIQEEGGDKTPNGKAFSLPKGIRSSDDKVVPRSKWPGKILPKESKVRGGGRPAGARTGKQIKPKPFLIQEQGGVGVYVRTDKKTRRLKRLYRLTRSTLRVKGEHWLQEPVEAVVKQHLADNFEKALEEAMRPRR